MLGRYPLATQPLATARASTVAVGAVASAAGVATVIGLNISIVLTPVTATASAAATVAAGGQWLFSGDAASLGSSSAAADAFAPADLYAESFGASSVVGASGTVTEADAFAEGFADANFPGATAVESVASSSGAAFGLWQPWYGLNATGESSATCTVYGFVEGSVGSFFYARGEATPEAASGPLIDALAESIGSSAVDGLGSEISDLYAYSGGISEATAEGSYIETIILEGNAYADGSSTAAFQNNVISIPSPVV